jgi:GTP cyclohydrolase IA
MTRRRSKRDQRYIEDGFAKAVQDMLMLSGALDDPDAVDLDIKHTPRRVARAYLGELLRGYQRTDADLRREVTTFSSRERVEMVVTSGIAFTSLCAHHMLPFHGTATIGYLPGKRLVGLSKLARILEHYAARLQVQERLGAQVATFLHKECGANFAVCLLDAEHQCMTCRGVKKPGAITHTSSIRPHDVDRSLLTEFYQLAGR